VMRYPSGPAFCWILPILPGLAWLANVSRIVLITGAGLSAGVEFSQGIFHTWGGLLVIAVMIGLTLVVFRVAEQITRSPVAQ